MFLLNQASSPKKQESSSEDDNFQPSAPNIIINDVGDEYRLTTEMAKPSVIGERSDESEKARDSVLSPDSVQTKVCEFEARKPAHEKLKLGQLIAYKSRSPVARNN